MADDQVKEIRSAIATLSYGLYVIGSSHEGRMNGQTCNTVFQITSEPVQIAIGINQRNLTHDLIAESDIFTVSVLASDGHDLVRKFGYRSGRAADKYEGVGYFTGVTGAPVLEDCVAYLECRVQKELCLNCGTHTLFVAQVEAGGMRKGGEPMTYAYYTATKFAKKPEVEEKKWQCLVCGYIHTGPEPPDRCPVCGAPKDKFVLLNGASGSTQNS